MAWRRRAGEPSFSSAELARRFRLTDVSRIGPDVRLVAYPPDEQTRTD
jgi:hypothetical protein